MKLDSRFALRSHTPLAILAALIAGVSALSGATALAAAPQPTPAAAAPSHSMEITASLSPPGASGLFGQYGPIGSVNIALGGGSTVTVVGLGAGLGFILPSSLEIMVNPFFTYLSASGASATVFGLTAGPVFNFGSDITDSPFIYLGPGFVLVSSGSTTTAGFQYTVGLGKRFSLGSHASYSPNVSYTGNTAGGYSSNIGITPVQFSFFI